MIETGPSAGLALGTNHLDADDEKAAKKLAKAAKKEKDGDGKAAEREQKLRWDSDKIQLKWVRLAILMAGIGFGADRTMQELVQGGATRGEILVLRLVVLSLAVLGMVALSVATLQHGRLLSAVVRNEPIPVARFPLSLVVSVIIVVLGTVALVVALLSLVGIGGPPRTAASAPTTFVSAGTVVVAAPATPVPPAAPATPAATQVVAVAPASAPNVGAALTGVATAAPLPTPAPTPTVEASQPAATQAPSTLAVRGTGPSGARLREAPVDGAIIAVLADGTRLTALAETTSAAGQLWQRVRTDDNREGWIAADLVAPTE